MAFYSILFAILFLGAFREVIRAFGASDWPTLWMAATLSMAIFNDVLYTSHYVEEKKAPYSIAMKLNDIVSFFLLGAAILVLQPGKDNIFEASPGPWVKSLPRERVFWGLLTAYWLTVISWNLFGSFYSGAHVPIVIHLVILLGFAAVLAASFLPYPTVQANAPWVAFAVFTLYAFILKPFVLRDMGPTIAKP
jgi:hypothetical protein